MKLKLKLMRCKVITALVTWELNTNHVAMSCCNERINMSTCVQCPVWVEQGGRQRGAVNTIEMSVVIKINYN